MKNIEYEIEMMLNGNKMIIGEKEWQELIGLIDDGDRIEIIAVRY